MTRQSHERVGITGESGMWSAELPRTPVNVLLVDDRPENLLALEAILEPLGENIVKARSANEALRQILLMDFAVVLLDVRMPGTGGLDTARLIKGRERSRLTPIVFITAFDADRRRVTEAYESGAVDYLFKPVDPEILKAKVAAFAELHRRGNEVEWQRRRRYADEMRRAAAEAELDRVTAVLASFPETTIVVDHEWRITYLNPEAATRADSMGRDPAAMAGKIIWDVLPELVGTKFHSESMRAIEEKITVEFEEFFPPLDAWFETRVVPMMDGAVSYSRDITERKRAAEVLALLNEAGRLLASSLDYETTLRNVVLLAAPRVADVACIDIAENGEEPRRVAATAPGETRGEAGDPGGLALPADTILEVFRSGTSRLIDDVPAWLDTMPPSEAGDALRSSGVRSLICLPLTARGETFGVITLAVSSSGRRFMMPHLDLAEELALRSATAIDRARLYEAERRAHASAEAARAEAEHASRIKSEFLATMSHELRTPLSAIIGYGELLADGITGPVNPGQRAQLERIKVSANHLLGLIEEILTFSRLEAGREHTQHEEIGIDEVLAEAAAIVSPLARAKGLAASFEGPSERVVIVTDSRKLCQILVNLGGNAVKFTDSGAVAVRAWADDGVAVFEVRDTGMGIAAEDLDRIWEPFQQVEQTHTRRAGGTGLGLSVTRRLARLLGGDVTVQSSMGTGSTFTVRIPRDGSVETTSQPDSTD